MKRIGFVVAPGHPVLIYAVASVFECANANAGETLYEVRLLSETGGPVPSSIGFRVDTAPLDGGDWDTLIVGGHTEMMPTSPGLLAFLREAPGRCRRIAGACIGAFALAEAGLLDGRRATTHWCAARLLQERFPAVTVEEDRIFIVDGPVWTSAGATAGIDLALAMVEADHGADAARAVARKLVVYHRRTGGQSQFSALLDLAPRSDRVQRALDHARRHLDSALTVEELAAAVHLSPRQFSRVFKAETGRSPAQAVEKLRVEAARLMMEEGRHSIETIARHTGFGDRERMRRAFLRAFGQPPQMVQRHALASAAAAGLVPA